jgi:ADP-heptose:LPS heptosyltransferase
MADHVCVWECPWFDKRRTANTTFGNLVSWIRKEQFDAVIELRGDVRLISLLKIAGATNIVGYGATGGGFLLDVDASRHLTSTISTAASSTAITVSKSS